MDSKNFAQLLVEELVDKHPPDSREFIRGCGIDPDNLDDPDEIWKFFVRCNLESLGIKSIIIGDRWNQIPENNILKQRAKLLDSIKSLEHTKCYKNFSTECPVEFRAGSFSNEEECCNKAKFDECPVIKITKELKWHKGHYKIAKIIVECAKRLLIENKYGKKNTNFNDVVEAVIEEHRGSDDVWKRKATEELIDLFKGIKWYGNPPKVIVWFFSELSSPVHQVNHWSELDLWQLTPVDTHVGRLAHRFGFLDNNNNIKDALDNIYPEEPRKLDFALYRFGGGVERDICGKEPDCEKCKKEVPKIYEACSCDIKY